MLKLRGGETLSKPQEITQDRINMANSLVDMRYYPFKGSLPTNISTEEAEYVPYEAKNLNTNVLEWDVDPAMEGYCDLDNSFVLTTKKPQVLGADVNPITGTQRIVFKPWSTLIEFKDTKLFLNNRDVSDVHDGGVYPYAALHKALLTEKDLDNIAGNVAYTSPHGTSFITQVFPTSSQSVFEDLYDWGGNNVDAEIETGNTIASYKYAKAIANNEFVAGTTTLTRLRDGIWRQDKFLPPSTQVRLQLVKNDVNKVLLFPTGANVAGTTILYTRATLYLRRVFPHKETIDSITQLAMTIPRQYPIVKSNTTYFTIPSGSSGFNRTALLTGSKPSVVVVQFVSANAFNGSAVIHPFSSESTVSLMKPDVSSMFLRVGSQRYPKNYEYGHDSLNFLEEGDDFVEYLRCCEPDAGDKLPARPMLNPMNKNLNVYVFNTRKNNENMFNRADDDTGLDGVEIHAKFNASIPSDVVCIMTAISNDVLEIDPSGKVIID